LARIKPASLDSQQALENQPNYFLLCEQVPFHDMLGKMKNNELLVNLAGLGEKTMQPLIVASVPHFTARTEVFCDLFENRC